MSETIIPTAAMRRGEIVQRQAVPENLPDELANFTWPKEYAKRLAEVAKVADALYEAHEAWTAAHEEFEDVAPGADQSALEAAIRAGEPDPGTPATDAADRAEHVAWTRLQLALDDARNTTYKDVLRDYLREQVEHLASHELTREQAHAEATRKAAELMAEVEQGSNKPGRASTVMKQYVAERWSEQDDTDSLIVVQEGDGLSRRTAIEQRNAAILARWRREANGEPEPAYDITEAKASELGAAVAYGSPVAAAELRRRKAAATA